MSDAEKVWGVKPLVCDTPKMLYQWCWTNGFVNEEGRIMDLPPEAVISFHDFLSERLQKMVEISQQQLMDWVNTHPLSCSFPMRAGETKEQQ